MPTTTIGETLDTSEWFDERRAVRLQREKFPQAFHDAFERMREWGLDTIEGMSCCGTCSSTVIEGYGAYYHKRDINSLIDESGSMMKQHPKPIYIGFSAPDDEKLIYSGRVVQAAFEAEGFKTHWHGDISRRVGVEVLEAEDGSSGGGGDV